MPPTVKGELFTEEPEEINHCIHAHLMAVTRLLGRAGPCR